MLFNPIFEEAEAAPESVERITANFSSEDLGQDLSGSMQGAGSVGGLLFICDVSSGVSHSVAQDGNGNVMALVNADTGAVSAQYEYGPFGEPLRATGTMAKNNPFRFSTKYTDGETGLVYYIGNWLIPGPGRWLKRDSMEETGSLNLYAFCANDAVNNFDPFGMKIAVVETEEYQKLDGEAVQDQTSAWFGEYHKAINQILDFMKKVKQSEFDEGVRRGDVKINGNLQKFVSLVERELGTAYVLQRRGGYGNAKSLLAQKAGSLTEDYDRAVLVVESHAITAEGVGVVRSLVNSEWVAQSRILNDLKGQFGEKGKLVTCFQDAALSLQKQGFDWPQTSYEVKADEKGRVCKIDFNPIRFLRGVKKTGEEDFTFKAE